MSLPSLPRKTTMTASSGLHTGGERRVEGAEVFPGPKESALLVCWETQLLGTVKTKLSIREGQTERVSDNDTRKSLFYEAQVD